MKKLLVVVGIFIGLGLGAFIIVNLTNESSSEPAEVSRNNEIVEQEVTASEKSEIEAYTTEEVAQHDSSSDCWTIIDGDIYNLTSFISGHPGGSEIERACGIDGTRLFENRETESGESVGSGTPHSGNASNQLQQLKIGTLVI